MEIEIEILLTGDPIYRRSSLEASGAMEGGETVSQEEIEDLLCDQKQADYRVIDLHHELSFLALHHA